MGDIYIYINEEGIPKQSTIEPTAIDRACADGGILSIIRIRTVPKEKQLDLSKFLVIESVVEEYGDGKWTTLQSSEIQTDPEGEGYHS